MKVALILLAVAAFVVLPVVLLLWLVRGLLKPKQKFVNWVGANDEETCEECRNTFKGNPYPISKAPQPGSFKYGDNCRHALQLTNAPNNKTKIVSER
jgi:hypothetical protein